MAVVALVLSLVALGAAVAAMLMVLDHGHAANPHEDT